MIKQYPSISTLRADALARNVLDGGQRWANYSSNNWYGETSAETQRRSEIGDLRLVPEAEKLMDKLESQIEVPRKVWERSVAGAFPCVPDYCNGLPTSMRRQVEIGDEHQPITVIYSINSSGSISAGTLRDRGVAVLSLVMALLRSRPVHLKMLFIGDGPPDGETVFTADINTSPLDLATACYVMTSAGFYRRIGFGVATALNQFRGGWPSKFNGTSPGSYLDYLANVLSNDPKRTLVIGPVYHRDPIVADPIAWINAQVKRFTEKDSES